jgi:hypothetical protein
MRRRSTAFIDGVRRKQQEAKEEREQQDRLEQRRAQLQRRQPRETEPETPETARLSQILGAKKRKPRWK